METHEYEVIVKWKNGRIGEMSSPVLDEKIACATPPEFPNGVPGIWSPEHLFTSAISSCLMTTFLAIAENSKLEFSSFECTSIGKLSKVDGKFMMEEVVLKPLVKIKREKDIERTIRILEKSDKACLISNSVKSKIILEPQVIVA